MARKRVASLLFPTGGLDRRYSLRNQPPFTTRNCQNVRPYATIEGRERGGSRPGLNRAYPEQLGSGSPIRMLNQVTTTTRDGVRIIIDEFDSDDLGGTWSTAPGIGTLPKILPEDDRDIVTASNDKVGAMYDFIDIETTNAYRIELFIVPHLNKHWGKYTIYARADDTTPLPTTDGLIAELTLDQIGGFSGTVKQISGGSGPSVTFGSTDPKPVAAWFKIIVNGNNVKAFWGDIEVVDFNFPAPIGKRVGFSMEVLDDGGITLVDAFRVQFLENVTQPPEAIRTFLVASSGGKVYKDKDLGSLTEVVTTATLASDRSLWSAEHTQKLYIADYSDPLEKQTDGAVNATGTEMTSPSIADFTALGINVDDHIVLIERDDDPGIRKSFSISSIQVGKLVLTTSAGATGGVTFTIYRSPKVFDPVENTLVTWEATAGKGSVPPSCPMIGTYRDRAILAGPKYAPHAWFMSRVGDPNDWDFGQTDEAAAVAGQSSTAGQIGQPITALIIYRDDYIIVGGVSTIWTIRGDPAIGGQVVNISRQIGIIDQGAWCRTPEGELIFLSQDGLYMLSKDANIEPISISRSRLPRELLRIDRTQTTVTMAYDIRDRGIHIYLVPNVSTPGRHWWFDWQTKSYWPTILDNNHVPFSLSDYQSDFGTDRYVLLGGRDGRIRRFHENNALDDGLSIRSFINYGPVRMSGDDSTEGILTELSAVVAEKSGAIEWTLQTSDSHGSLGNGRNFATGRWSTPVSQTTRTLSHTERPRARAGSFSILLQNGEDKPWAIEKITATYRKAGKHRVF